MSNKISMFDEDIVRYGTARIAGPLKRDLRLVMATFLAVHIVGPQGHLPIFYLVIFAKYFLLRLARPQLHQPLLSCSPRPCPPGLDRLSFLRSGS